MESLDWTVILGSIMTALNTGWIIYQSYKKNKPEVKKLEHEAESEMAEAAGVILEGTKLSGEILMTRILELKADLETEKKHRKEEGEYLRRRIRDAERESRDYRIWAAKLAKQVIEAGKIPELFIPSSADTEPFSPVEKTAKFTQEIELLKRKEEEKEIKSKEETNDKQPGNTV